MVSLVSLGLLTVTSSVGAVTIQRISPSQYTDTAEHVYMWMKQNYPKQRTLPDWNDDKTNNGVHWMQAQEAWKIKYSQDSSERFSWTKEYDDSVFLTNVAPITHFDEVAEGWMPVMREHLTTDAKGHKKFFNRQGTDKSLKEVAQFVVKNVWSAFGKPYITFKPNQTPKILAPLSDVLIQRHGSCTAMSIFLADALRSVGVPARVVGIAKWNRDEGGNHNWVEAYFDGKWNFIDAVPGTTTWNSAWFTESGLAQKSQTKDMSQILTPVWDNQRKGKTVYHITWSKADTDAKDFKVYMELPAIDLTAQYKKLPEGPVAEHAGSRLTFSLSVFPLLAMILAL